MYAKLVSDKLVQPPACFVRPNGDTVGGYNNPCNESMWIADGFCFVEECPKPLGNYRPVYEKHTDSIVQTWEAFTPEAQTVQYSKRRIRLALTARRLNDAFTAFLESSTELHQAWEDSTVLESSDQLFIQALSAFCISAGISDTVLKDILTESIAI